MPVLEKCLRDPSKRDPQVPRPLPWWNAAPWRRRRKRTSEMVGVDEDNQAQRLNWCQSTLSQRLELQGASAWLADDVLCSYRLTWVLQLQAALHDAACGHTEGCARLWEWPQAERAATSDRSWLLHVFWALSSSAILRCVRDFERLTIK